jgi:DNA-binding beta-propeller fold protein YncE
LLIPCVVAVSTGFFLNAFANTVTVEYEYVGEWGGEGDGEGEFSLPWDIALAANGNVYVADDRNDRVQYFTPEGEFLGLWDGSPPGVFKWPGDIAVAPGGVVYLSDGFNCRLQYFSADGDYLGEWGRRGSGEGEFRSPGGLAIAGDGRVYVADTGNGRIQYFTADGEYLGAWRPEVADEKIVRNARDVAVSPTGRVYAVFGYGIHYFSPESGERGKWGSEGEGDGQFKSWPRALAVSKDGTVYVNDAANDRIQYFDADGSFLGKWENIFSSNNGAEVSPHLLDVAVAPDGNVVVIGGWPLELRFFSRKGELLKAWPGPLAGETSSTYRVAVGLNGCVYFLDKYGDAVYYYDGDGNYLGRWGPGPEGNGQFKVPGSIAVAPDGTVYVIAYSKHKVDRFTPSGSYISGWEKGDESRHEWWDIVVAPSGDVYVNDVTEDVVHHFTADGYRIGDLSLGEEAARERSRFNGRLAVTTEGDVFATDYLHGLVYRFSSSGALFDTWGNNGRGSAEFHFPNAIAVSPAGAVFICDETEDRKARIRVFTLKGDYKGDVMMPEDTGSRDVRVSALEISGANILYVADTANHRILYFRQFDGVE